MSHPLIKVEHVPGRLMPHPTRVGEFVGLRKLRKSDDVPADQIAHAFHDGPRFVSAGVVEVPHTTTIERALMRGDLRRADEQPAAAPSAPVDAES